MRRQFIRVLAVSSLLLLIASPLAFAQNSQDVQRSVVKGRWSLSDPVRIMAVFYDGKPIKSRVPFPAPDDWLNHVSLLVENDSPKTLIAGFIQVAFPDLGVPVPIKTIDFGRFPDAQLYTSTGEKKQRRPGEVPISIPPGKSVIVNMSTDYQRLEELLESRGSLSKVTLCVIDNGAFYFDDDTRWMEGSFTRADLSKPGTYSPITREDFNKVISNK
jgi:hypothetical protein